jgi:hypothetical protein
LGPTPAAAYAAEYHGDKKSTERGIHLSMKLPNFPGYRYHGADEFQGK